MKVPAIPQVTKAGVKRCECRGCGRLLFKSTLTPATWVEIKCYACNTMNVFNIPQSEAA